MKGLKELYAQYELIGDVRGVGLMAAIELVEDRTTKIPAKAKRNAILKSAFEKGVCLLPAGQSVIRFSPPLVISDEEIDVGLSVLDRCFAEATGS